MVPQTASSYWARSRKLANGWAIATAFVLIGIIASQSGAAWAGPSIQTLGGAIAMSIGVFWAVSTASHQLGDPLRDAVLWGTAFLLACAWFWLGGGDLGEWLGLSFERSNEHLPYQPGVSVYRHTRFFGVGPSRLVTAELLFGFLGGTMVHGASAFQARWTRWPWILLGGLAWSVATAVGGYVALAGFWLLGNVIGILLQPIAPAGAFIGVMMGGWLGGFVAAMIGLPLHQYARRALLS